MDVCLPVWCLFVILYVFITAKPPLVITCHAFNNKRSPWKCFTLGTLPVLPKCISILIIKLINLHFICFELMRRLIVFKFMALATSPPSRSPVPLLKNGKQAPYFHSEVPKVLVSLSLSPTDAGRRVPLRTHRHPGVRPLATT